MFLEVARLMLGYEVVKRSGEEREVAVVVIGDCVGKCVIWHGHEVLKINVQGGKVVDSQAVNLRDVIIVARHSARGWDAG